MSFIKAYIDGIKKWKHWDGRTRRRDYWKYIVCHNIIANLLYIIGWVCDELNQDGLMIFCMFLYFAYTILSIVPTLAITLRRLHDTNKGFLYYFVTLVPCIGQIWFLALMAKKGDVGRNQFGPDPKDEFSEDQSVQYGDYPDFH